MCCQVYLYAVSILLNMELRAVFIDNVKKYRKQNKLSQMALAERCETSTSYIGEIEIGKKFPSVEMIQKIALALNVQPYRLFMEEKDFYISNIPIEDKQELAEKIQKAVTSIIMGETK